MAQDPYFTLMRQALSKDRLEAYRLTPSDTDTGLLGRYFWNMALSEALYPVLQCLEVALRNSVHAALGRSLGTTHWYNAPSSFLAGYELNQVNDARAYLASQGKPIDPGRVVAGLRFGFWTALFDRRYEPHIRPVLKDIFPGMPRRIRNHRTLTSRLNQARVLRNRVFHHEPIIKAPGVDTRHQHALETIGWINPTLRSSMTEFDRFPAVFAQGQAAYSEKVNVLLQKRTRSHQK